MTCVSCGATLRPDDAWCGLCFVPVPEPPAEKRHEFLPPTVPTYSRWRKSETSFGLVGRIGWTVGVVAVMGLTIVSLNPFAMIAWLIIGGPLILRSVWARKRIT